MKEIVDRLQAEHHSKSILERKGYITEKRMTAPARNDSSTKEEKVRYASQLIKDARSTGDASIAWELVDFLHDTLLLYEIADVDEVSIDLGKFREFEDKDYRDYAAYDLPDGTSPLLYVGSNEFDMIISGDEDDNVDVILSYVPYSEGNDEEYHKIFSDTKGAIAAGEEIISILEAPEFEGEKLAGATPILKSKGFKTTLYFNN